MSSLFLNHRHHIGAPNDRAHNPVSTRLFLFCFEPIDAAVHSIAQVADSTLTGVDPTETVRGQAMR